LGVNTVHGLLLTLLDVLRDHLVLDFNAFIAAARRHALLQKIKTTAVLS
jgi:hypothetical protein